jgi:hypothetical protein
MRKVGLFDRATIKFVIGVIAITCNGDEPS